MIELSSEIKKEFEAHAKADSPWEACGLVAIVKGKQRYYKCNNISESVDDFILDPKDFMAVEDSIQQHAGDIVMVLHSHPKTPEKPSTADLVGCENSGLAWSIYSTKTNKWFSFAPSGFKAPLIGRPFKHGVFDCYSAARDWYVQNMGIHIPEYPRDLHWWEKGQNLFMENFEGAGFYEVKDGSLEVGDAFLATINSPVVNHCMVYIGKDQVFHQTMNRLSGREIYGGYLKKNTRIQLRYKR